MNAKCECDAKIVRCEAMDFDKKSANANAMRKSFHTTIPGPTPRQEAMSVRNYSKTEEILVRMEIPQLLVTIG